MSSIKMIALRKHPFGTGEREAGEEYSATAAESAILIALGWAEKAQKKEAVHAPAAEPAPAPASQPEPAPSLETAPEKKALEADAGDKKRAYQRRDMKAKD